ncbi:MAG: efflux RND transporter periplasmic adaptor subunit [Zunongwangia sp.]|uniref:RND family efflux transporter, MFP subunit n=3 Tax=Flavobacteriaceae TaxID=49546 RepID=I3C277_9FLAO|nr:MULTISPECIES: efflux RND transporter periplasmic adaptor subunit [Flavobacteriaceae]MAG87497.1 efflux RND transporter periplasmic adaptor subunit [Flavobacteriaceae bacterium]MAO37002.1 efflux RND transporter periplasmic adaptor subunit [Zunongwangia sp.]ADF54583.1 HlyD family secretion protein [Zunongwangia profunda SM-A87]EIJ37720.1 RND family efflux transporter, MFP subunit [Galbibacter orientalis DSM 19592]MCC4226954.1 efflux RND transporter periplasmic adaptor subunit [Zunongwangia pro|tara:strand:+ start:1504 stop:2703 length:1200 start_codon:yes stop_codon:yes gene_type:complete
MKIKFNTKISLLILSTLLVVACGNKDSEKMESSEESSMKEEQLVATGIKQITFTKDQYNLAEIETGAIEMRNLSNIIKLNGTIDVEPESMASVSAPLGGYLKTAGRLPGEAIKKGQVLATIENPEFIQIQQGYLESLSRLQFLEEEFNRQKKLREEDINSAKTFQQVSSDYKITQGRVKAYEQQLALAGIIRSSVQNGNITRTANLYAPISGFIKASNVNIGDYVSPQDVLFELVDLNDIHLALNAFERDLEKLEIGQTVKFSLSDDNTFNRTAEIFIIGKATGSDRMTPVHCHIKQENQKGLLPGMYVKAWVESGTNKQNAIPSAALVQYEGKDYVILQTEETENGYTFKLEQVKKGIEQEGYTAITFADGATVQNFKPVVKNAYSILSALRNSEEEE